MSLPSARSVAGELSTRIAVRFGLSRQDAKRIEELIEVVLVRDREAVRQACAEAAMTERKDEERGTPRSDGYIEGCLSCRDAINHLDITGTSPRKETP